MPWCLWHQAPGRAPPRRSRKQRTERRAIPLPMGMARRSFSLTGAGLCQPMVIAVGGLEFDPTLTGSPENTALM
jgi:hypothetical protein